MHHMFMIICEARYMPRHGMKLALLEQGDEEDGGYLDRRLGGRIMEVEIDVRYEPNSVYHRK